MGRCSVVPSSYVYPRRGGAVLGHVELGETAADAGVREAREELGIGIHSTDLSPIAVMQRTDGTDDPIEQRVDWFFTCDARQGEPRILEPRNCAELAWFDLDALPDLMPEYEREALSALRAGGSATLLSHWF